MVSLCAALLLCALCIVLASLFGGWLGRRSVLRGQGSWRCDHCDKESLIVQRSCVWCGKARRDR